MDRPETTVGAAVRNATAALGNAGIGGSRDEAEIILAAVMKIPRWKLIVDSGQKIPPRVEEAYEKAVLARAGRCPLPYILGVKEFYGADFHVSPAVLIPRPETEVVVEAVMAALGENGSAKGEGLNIIEMGTGSGAIVVTLARLLPAARFQAVDISAAALSIARRNALNQGVEKRIRFLKSDYWKIFDGREERFEVIVSNPPYIPSSKIKTLSPEIKDHEPTRALDGGRDGLDSYRSLLSGLREHATPSALLVMEIGVEVADAVKELCKQVAMVASLKVIKDYQGHDRVVVARLR